MSRQRIEKEEVEEVEVEAPKEKSQREILWLQFLKNYKAKNPVKFASKEANGEFKVIPASFIGKIRTVKGLELIY